MTPLPHITTADILARRPPKEPVDPYRPYAWLVEPECTAAGVVDPVATLFLTNRECPFHCLYCDLWKHTLDQPTPSGAIPEQIRFALAQLPPAKHIKLYNSGNFFDPLAIPPGDYPAIAELVQSFETVIVENHPRLMNTHIAEFQSLLTGRLEVALGLETVHPQILPRLNKQMTVADYQRACETLRNSDIDIRTFVLLRPPGLTDDEGITWALQSIETAFAAGSHCVSLIPMRSGNGVMEDLAQQGLFTPPSITAMYEVQRQALQLQRGRVFVDLWGIEALFECPTCGPQQSAVLNGMNLTQRVLPWVECKCGIS
ncbi:radical SAM protein [bacterium]|nr:radical SAM protein [bacterium]